MTEPYYMTYEKRYQKVFAAGGERWGHEPDDEVLVAFLEKWVRENRLAGKKVIEFACGEGACGVILSKLGCRYYGVDIAPSAVAKAKDALREFPNARVDVMDMVRETTGEVVKLLRSADAALDCMGFHMLVTDGDRNTYLRNAYGLLKSGAPMLFFRQSYRDSVYDNRETSFEGQVETFEEWKTISGDDYDTPFQRHVKGAQGDVEVWVPLVPGRANSREGYEREMRAAGFDVEDFLLMDPSTTIPCSASIFLKKP